MNAYSSESRAVSTRHFEQILQAGHFAVTTEIAPPDSSNPEDIYTQAGIFAGLVDAINATDGAGANCHMSSLAVCSLLNAKGYSSILQVSCRDRNRIAIQGDVLGASAIGIENVLCLTGDGVQAGDQPDAKPVFDLDSISLLETLRQMRDEARFLSGREISDPPEIFLGAVANPFAEPLSIRAHRLAKKIAAGAEFIQTQYCFDIPRLRDYMARVRDFGLLEEVHILIGVGVLVSARSARWMREHIPGVHVPDDVIHRLESADDERAEGVRIAVEMMQQIKEVEGVSGIHVMAFHHKQLAAQAIRESGVLGCREPWCPDRAIQN